MQTRSRREDKTPCGRDLLAIDHHRADGSATLRVAFRRVIDRDHHLEGAHRRLAAGKHVALVGRLSVNPEPDLPLRRDQDRTRRVRIERRGRVASTVIHHQCQPGLLLRERHLEGDRGPPAGECRPVVVKNRPYNRSLAARRRGDRNPEPSLANDARVGLVMIGPAKKPRMIAVKMVYHDRLRCRHRLGIGCHQPRAKPLGHPQHIVAVRRMAARHVHLSVDHEHIRPPGGIDAHGELGAKVDDFTRWRDDGEPVGRGWHIGRDSATSEKDAVGREDLDLHRCMKGDNRA